MPLGDRSLGVFTVIEEKGDHLLCRAWNGKETLVAKPWMLRRSSFDGKTFNEISYEYADVNERTASKADENDETQYITPGYFLGEKIVAYPHSAIAGVQSEELKWEDINLAGRCWAVEAVCFVDSVSTDGPFVLGSVLAPIPDLELTLSVKKGDTLDVTAVVAMEHTSPDPDVSGRPCYPDFQILISSGATEEIGRIDLRLGEWEYLTKDEVTILGFKADLPETLISDDTVTIQVLGANTVVYSTVTTYKGRLTTRVVR